MARTPSTFNPDASVEGVSPQDIMDVAIEARHIGDGEIVADGLGDDSVTNAKLANITRGSVKVGGAADAPTDLVALTDKQILVGDGTDINSVAVSGDATIDNAGAFTIAEGAVEDSMIEGLADGEILIGVDGTAANNAKVVAAGDVTIANDGTTAIQAAAVESAMNEASLIRTVEMTLTAAEVKAIYSANTNQGHLILAAQGADTVIEFISASLRYNYDGSNAYTAANGLTFNVAAVAVSDTIANTFLQGTADRLAIVQALSAEIDEDAATVANKALYLQEGTQNPTGAGTEADTILLRVAYRVHNIAV